MKDSLSQEAPEAQEEELELPPDAPDYALLTGALIGVNVVVYLAMLLVGAGGNPTCEQLLRFGATHGEAVFGQNEWWRLVTSAFVHIGILHLSVNMWSLWEMGRVVELLLGRKALTLFYFLGAIGSSLVSLAWDGSSVSVGASGALFALDGAVVVWLISSKAALPRGLRRRWGVNLGMFMLYSIAAGFMSPNVDNAAHIGGALVGLATGLAWVWRPAKARVAPWLKGGALAGIGLVLVAVAGFGVQRQIALPSIEEESAETSIDVETLENSVSLLTGKIDASPKQARNYLERARLSSKLGREEVALEDYLKAYELDPTLKEAVEGACTLDFLGERVEACEKVLKGSASSVELLEAHMMLAQSAEFPDSVILSDLNQLVTLDADAAQFVAMRAHFHIDRNDWEPALRDLERAIALAPDEWVYRFDRATVHKEKGDIRAAIKGLDETFYALRGDEDDAALNFRARLQLFAGNPDAAIADARRSISLVEESAEAWSLLCFGLFEKREQKEGVTACRRARELSSDMDLGVGLVEGSLLSLQGKLGEAANSWEEAREDELWADLVEGWLPRVQKRAPSGRKP